MTSFVFVVFTLIAIYMPSTCESSACPCKNTSLCNNIKTNYTKELYGFIGGSKSQYNDTNQYNWTYTTAFAVNNDHTNDTGMNETMCTAHSHGVRMILWGYPKMPFTNDINIQMNWIKNLFNLVKFLNYDGVTFDYEGSMLWNDPKDAQYVAIVNKTTQYFHENLPGSTISVCVPFQAYLQWGRQYDYYSLSEVSDYLYIMGYDTNGQIWDGQCIARAVSPIMNIQRGVQSYINLNINPFKLILGIPWYGKINECIVDELDGGITSKFCPIVPKDNKGVNCSNGGWHANPEQGYAEIMSIDCNGKNNVTDIRWDNTQRTSYCNYWFGGKPNETLMQVWFDDPKSLTYKYQYAKSMGLRGLGPFQFGDLIYDNSDEEKTRAQTMWSAFDSFYLD